MKKEDSITIDNNTNIKIKKPISKAKKYLIVISLSIYALFTSLCSSAFYPALENIKEDLSITENDIDVTLSMTYVIGGIFPIVWGVLSDEYGRKKNFIFMVFLTLIGSVFICFSNSKYTFIASKLIENAGSSGAAIVSLGIISDLFCFEERGFASGIYLLLPTLAGALGPLASGILISYFGWRSTFLIYSLLLLVSFLIILFVPETLKTKKPYPLQFNKKTFIKKVGPFINVFKGLKLMKHNIIIMTLLITTFSIVPISNLATILPRIVTQRYKLNSFDVGFVMLVLGIGETFGSVIGGRLADYFLKRSTKNGTTIIESRLKCMIVTIPLTGITLGITGFLIDNMAPINIILSVLFFTTFSLGVSLISISNYLLDLFPNDSSQVYSVNVFWIFILTSLTTLGNTPFLETVGVSYMYLIYGSMSLLSMIFLVYLIKRGRFLIDRLKQREENSV